MTAHAINQSTPLTAGSASANAETARPQVSRVLIVEDELLIAHNLAEILQRQGYDVCGIATTGARAIALAQATLPDLVLMDINLKGVMDGIETASLVAPYGQPAIVFLSAYSEEETLRRATASGAYGYLVKPVQEPTLLATIGVVLGRLAMERTGKLTLDDLKSELSSARQASLTDGLTGVYNRDGMELQISREMDRARRRGETVALMLIDVDHFKLINDRHGHQQGDQAITHVARCIAETVRPTDIVARFGGDEFVVFAADNCTPEGARALGLRIGDQIRRRACATEEVAIPLTVSIGIVTVTAGQHLQVDELVRAADRELYRAKAAGRDCIKSIEYELAG